MGKYVSRTRNPTRRQRCTALCCMKFRADHRYTFDSRPLQSREGDRVQKLCRKLPNGTTSCIILGLETERLFMTMQSQGYFCALPAEPNQTHMECHKIPK